MSVSASASSLAIERRQLDAPGALQPLELGQQRAQRVAAVQLVGAVGEQQQQPLLAQAAGQEGDECPGRAVGPVQVLQDQHHGLRLAEQVEQLQQRLEQPQLPGRIAGARRAGARRRRPGRIAAS